MKLTEVVTAGSNQGGGQTAARASTVLARFGFVPIECLLIITE
jgi:hypothetical protein